MFTGPIYILCELPSGRFDVLFCRDSHGNVGQDRYALTPKQADAIVRELCAAGAHVQYAD